jgi:hypothetical protein
VRGGRATSITSAPGSGRAVTIHASKRVCADKACHTVLSIYNSADVCFLHEPRARLSRNDVNR